MTLQDIRIKVSDTRGMTMDLVVPADDTLDDWQMTLKTIMTFLQFSVDEVVINPGSDDPQGEDKE